MLFMSGHSKWSTIKRQKGVADAKRGTVFTKLAVAITIAVRQGGGIGDPGQNFKLRLMIEKAGAANMPKENIERAIEKGKGGADGGRVLDEVVYEGFGPHGASAIMVVAATDNKQRTTGEVKNTWEKSGGIFGKQGSVSYQFVQNGLITVVKKDRTFDDIMLVCADLGAEDVEEAGRQVLVYTKPDELGRIREALRVQGFTVVGTELIRKPTVTQVIEDKEVAEKTVAILNKLEELDDVQKVYTNAVFSDKLSFRA